MSKNFWKMTTIGLVGYIVGMERLSYKPTPYGQLNHKKTFREQIGEILINKAKYLFYGTIPSTRTVDYCSIKPSFRTYSQSGKPVELSNIMYGTHQDAAEVLDALKKDIDNWNAASMEDAYMYSGYSAPAGSDKKGWTSLDNAEINQVMEDNKVYWTINWPPVKEFEEEE